MERLALRRTGALIASAALLASLTTVTTVAAAGKCLPWKNGDIMETGNCYYATEPVEYPTKVAADITLNGTDAHDEVWLLQGTFNGGDGDDEVEEVRSVGTFNGGTGNDTVLDRVVDGGVFNGGPGDDAVSANGLIFYDGRLEGTFNGGGGDDCVDLVSDTGTFAGGGGSDEYGSTLSDNVWSAEPGSCPIP